MKIEFNIEGMTCNHCANSVERAAKSTQGVKDATVDLANGLLVVECDSDVSSAICDSVEAVGFGISRK